MLQSIPTTITDCWRHCGLKVQGCWSENPKGGFQGHTYWKLLVVHSGAVELEEANERVICVSGQAMLLPPNTPGQQAPAPGTEATNVLFTPLPAASWRSPWQLLATPAVTTFNSHADMLDLLELFGHGTGWASPEGAIEARLLFDRVLWEFVRDGLRSGDIQPAAVRPAWIDELVKAASRSCGDPNFGVQDLVRLAGCSHQHLGRALRACEDRSPGELLRFLRVNKASHLVESHPGITTRELVERCGFRSERQAQRQFLSQTGRTLTEARMTAKQA